MAQEFDVVVIGGGPGGYVAALRASQLGFKVACIDKRGVLGGTCLNVGCIPSKAMLHSSEKFHELTTNIEAHGIKVKDVSLDLDTMLARKNKVVKDLTQGITYLFKKQNIEYINGSAKLTGPKSVTVTLADNKTTVVSAHNIIIATGSVAATLPGITIDEKTILSSTGALELAVVPKHLVVVGGGYIGLEMGSVWKRLGANVTVVEYAPQVVPTMDHEISLHLQKSLMKQGMVMKLETAVKSIAVNNGNAIVTVQPAKGDGKEETITCDKVLIAVGRKPYTEGLGLAEVGIQCDPKGYIIVNDQWRTAVANIFAIGDVVHGPMLAHKAEEEGCAVAEIIAGQSGHVDYNTVPGVIYTYPEVGTVGKTEAQLKQEGRQYRVGKFPFSANSRARACGETDGFVKILADAQTDEVLGVHIIAPHAGTMIAETVVAMEFKAAAEDIARICHAHPTWNEAVKEAALAVAQRALHI